MSRVLFGRGAKGSLVADVQTALIGAGFETGGVDGVFGSETEAAVRGFQLQRGTIATGAMSDDDWRTLTGREVPAIEARCLQLTAAFEGHNYTLAVGNFDGAILTWGIIGFTLADGEVQQIVLNIHAAFPQLVEDAFAENAEELLEVMQASKARQKTWADRNTLAHGRLAEPWRSAFARFGHFPEVQAEQNRRAHDDYFLPALRSAATLGITTERGVALCFDIHVQNGGIKQKIRDRLEPLEPGEPEQPLLETLAVEVAKSSKPEFREDVKKRKMTIATGGGTVHGKHYELANWGLLPIAAAVV